MGKQSKNANKKNTQPQPTKPKGPPFEMSVQEYSDLIEQVKDLTLQEIQEEWILAARYGDVDILYAISEHSPHFSPSVVNCQDATNGNTALHMAAANGHVAVIETLLKFQPQHKLTNHAGNTPLHWAAANGHEQAVQLLVNLPDVDVLQKNEFGRSVLTEGFASEKTEVIKLILEHDSAAEERLVQGGKEIDVEEEEEEEDEKENTTSAKKDAVVHEFNFQTTTNTTSPLKIRELPIPNTKDPFGDKPELDTTGYGIWAASLVMARWMAESADRFHGKRLLELGAGCGVPGLAAAFYSDAKQVHLTDLNPTTLDNLKYNIDLNQRQTCPSNTSWLDRLRSGPINWEDSNTWPNEKMDFIIGSDLIYQASIAPILKKVVLGLCQGQGTFLYVAPDTESDIGRDGLAEFIQQMTETEGCTLVSDRLAPKEYHANPLASQDDDLCFLHFHELSSGSYRLYEFQINIPK